MMEGNSDPIRFKYCIGLISGMALFIFLLGFLIYHNIFHQITIIDGMNIQTFVSAAPNVAEAVRQKRITLRKGDRVIPHLKTQITRDVEIKISRAFPVTIRFLGKTQVFDAIPQTIRAVLKHAKIRLGRNDRVIPDLGSCVEPYQQISVTRVTTKIIIQSVILKAATRYSEPHGTADDHRLHAGWAGEAWQWFKVVYEDGKEVKRILLKERIMKPPANNALIARSRFGAGFSGEPVRHYSIVQMKTMEATAYYPGPECTGKYAVYGLTYTGKKARYGLVAVDPRVIALGTMLYIEGYGLAEAADIGGAIKGDKIDLCFNTYREAVEYGRRKISVYIVADVTQR